MKWFVYVPIERTLEMYEIFANSESEAISEVLRGGGKFADLLAITHRGDTYATCDKAYVESYT